MPQIHPPKDQLMAFGQGKLAADESSQIEQHLGVCPECCETLLDLKDDTFTGLVRAARAAHGELGAAGVVVAPDRGMGRATEPDAEHAFRPAAADVGNAVTVGVPASDTRLVDDLPIELEEHARYRIVELVGRGGMGSVYRAEHRLMNRPVAIKVINAQLVQNAQAVGRFRREVQAAAKLSHPNIVAAYDAEQAGSVHFLAMEFVDGTDLATVVHERGSLPVAEACVYIGQAAVGLQHAHELGMVHRDIKPHNLMVAARGQVRILDFGLAGFASLECGDSSPLSLPETADRQPTGTEGKQGGDESPHSKAHLTALGSVMGTPDYMAPEQAADAHSADIRADIYSLGCTLHFLLSGKPPFEADNAIEKIMAHAEESPPDLTAMRSDVPRELAAVVSRMMAKKPADRFQTPAEVAAALAPFTRPAEAPPRKRTLRKVLAAAAAILIAGVIYIATDKGRIEIRTEVDDVDIVVSQGGKDIRTIDLATGSQVTWIPSGDYTISLKQDRNDIQITPNGFMLSRWGKQIVSLSRSPAAGVAGDHERRQTDLPAGAMSETVTTGHNGGFEVTKSGLPVTWFFYTPRTVPKGDFDIVMDTTDFKEGEQSLKFVVRKCEPTGGRLSPGFFNEFHVENHNPPGPFETKPGETYKISFWAKNAGSEFVFKARGVSATKGDPGAIIRSKETFDEWRRFECTYTIPPQMWLRLELNVVQPGTFWIDDIQIVKVNDKAAATPAAEPSGAAASGPSDEARLQGKWVAVSGHARKQAIPAEQLKQMSIAFDGDQVTFDQPGVPSGSQRGTFKINANSNPKQITLVAPDPKKETLPGIYEFDGERIKLALVDEDYARPTNFDPDDRADHMTLVLERAPRTGPALGPTEREALKAAQEFLAVMDEGKFGQLFDMSAAWAKRNTTREKTSQSHQTIRDSFGKAIHRTLHRAHLLDRPPHLPEGRYAGVQFKSRFERQEVLWETVLLNVEPDGKWRVNTYAWTLDEPTLPEPQPATDDPATTQKKQAARAAAAEWLKLVDGGKYGEAWDTSAKANKDGIKRDGMDLAYQGLFQPLGPIKSRELKTNEYKTQLPRAPVGEYAIIQFSTQFINGRVTETVVLTRESDGQWRVSGYFHSEARRTQRHRGHRDGIGCLSLCSLCLCVSTYYLRSTQS
jgi:uncharacterized protein (TIGR03067 family)